MKKKYGLFKVLAVMLLLIVVATYFIDGRDGSVVYLALGDVVFNYVQSFYYFFDTAIFILVVGGFYGFLNRIPAYKKIVRSISEKLSDKKKIFVIIMTVLFALVSSLSGLNLLLLLFVPLVVSIILLLGYDKLVALTTTIGGIIVGIIGGIFFTLKDPSSSYSVSYVTFDKLVGLDSNFINVLPRILLLVIGIGLLVFYILSYIKKCENNESNYKLTKSDNLFIDLKDRNGKVVEQESSKSIIPLVITMIILLVLVVLGYFPWNDLFGISCFSEFHTWLTGLKIGDYSVFTNLISSTIYAFGSWGSLGNYMMAVFVLIVLMFVLKFIYGVKFDDAMDGFILGVKRMIPASMIAMLACCILVCTYNNGFMETIIVSASDKFGDNVVISSLISMLGSITHIDTYYVSAGIFSNIVTNLTDSANLSIYSVMFQSIYGLVQIVGPTSLILIVGLSYLEVPYKTWLKYIWRFVVQLVIVVLVILMIVSLL